MTRLKSKRREDVMHKNNKMVKQQPKEEERNINKTKKGIEDLSM